MRQKNWVLYDRYVQSINMANELSVVWTTSACDGLMANENPVTNH